MDHTSANLATNVRRLRDARQLTQRQLADVSGVPRPTVAHIESGAANPTLHVLVKVAGALGATIEELIGTPPAATRFYGRDALPRRSRGKLSVHDLLAEPLPGMTLLRTEMAPGASLRVGGPGVGSRQYLACEAGQLEVTAADRVWRMGPGDVVVTRGPAGPTVVNRSRKRAVVYSVTAPVPTGA